MARGLGVRVNSFAAKGLTAEGAEGTEGGMIKKRPSRRASSLQILLLLVVSACAEGRMEKVFFESDDALIPSREVRVWFPPGYDTGDERYPVLYFHDGQNVFRPGGSFGCWFAEDAALEEIKAGRMRESILVVIPNNEADMGKARVTEYQPPSDLNPRDPQRGNGICDRYANFLVGKVKSGIDAKYRTLSDTENTAVAGASMGGLVSLWLGLNTEAFGAVGVFSPAFWTSPNFTQSLVGGSKKDGLRIYLDMGTKEQGNLSGDYWEDALAVRDALLAQGYIEGENFLWNPGEGDEHNEKAWAKRLPVALRFLVPGEKAAAR